MMSFPFIHQHDQMDCGPSCLAMITHYYKRKISLQYLRENCFLTKEGVSLLSISEAAKKIGYESTPVKISYNNLLEKGVSKPAIIHWNQNHFVVLINIKKSFFSNDYKFIIADPGHGIITLNEKEFKMSWLNGSNLGVVLFLKPLDLLYKNNFPLENKKTLKYFYKYLLPHKGSIIKLIIFLFLGSLISLIFPFLTQQLIDKGVLMKNLSFVKLILLSQLLLFIGSITIEIARNWVMLFMGARINIEIISDFLSKLLKMPLKFFDTKLTGDLNQRINDHERVENFLTSQGLTTFFSMITFLVFFIVLCYYNVYIVLIYLILSFISILWSTYWLKKLKILDYNKFQIRSENQESIYEMINGITELKLNNMQDYKRNEWLSIQEKLFKSNTSILKISQLQSGGFNFFNHLKNILVTFIAASFVTKGNMTIGVLLSISYIVGQMNSPVNQLIDFFKSFQDAKLSLDRLNEIQEQNDEDYLFDKENDINILKSQDIQIKNVSFQYEGPKSQIVLKNLNFIIPKNSVTAIVGASGSGKSTLIKILLKYYEPTNGSINYGLKNLENISNKVIRKSSGIVMQEGFLFGDSIERNIICGDEKLNELNLINAVKISNIGDFIKSLPLHMKTKIGISGMGISGGQKQRILIARAIYKNPSFLFLDEATSALDSENEKIIHDNLQSFFQGRTVIIVAHRLSTVKNADQIIVLDKGEVVEIGNHEFLTQKKGYYYNLVKNQLELGQ